MDTKMKVMTETLEDLVDKELKQFIRQLWIGVTPGTEPISRSKLQTSDREDVVDCMISQYPDDAGEIAVQALRNIKQNNLADRLEENFRKQPVQESMEMQPIQSGWHRPPSITPCNKLFKDKLLTKERNEIYIPASSQRKGSALLITNIIFDKSSQRSGAEIDEENMEWLLGALGYSVEKHRNLSGEEINTAVRNFSKRYEHQDSDSTFVVIMSHGQRIQNKDAILGVHYDPNEHPDDIFFVEDIFSHLNSVSCPALIDKPKVILIQACREVTPATGYSGGMYCSDSAFESDSWVHKEKDFVCFMSSLPDVCAFRDPTNGSFFINYIVDMFSTSAHKYDIMELFRKIASRMQNDPRFSQSKKLLPCIERTTLVKKFYLFPGLMK